MRDCFVQQLGDRVPRVIYQGDVTLTDGTLLKSRNVPICHNARHNGGRSMLMHRGTTINIGGEMITLNASKYTGNQADT